MRLQLAVRHDVFDVPSTDREIVGNNSPMASPPQPLRTHVRSPRAGTGLSQFVQPRIEIRALRIVSVRAKRRKLPRCVRRILALRMPPPAQLLEPSVFDSNPPERARKFRLVELRPSLRTRERAHVNDGRDSMLAQKLEELFDRMRRMPDCENARRRFCRMICLLSAGSRRGLLHVRGFDLGFALVRDRHQQHGIGMQIFLRDRQHVVFADRFD